MSPDEINKSHGKVVYRCRVCRVESGLVWFNGTSCPVCLKPECAKELWREWDGAIAAMSEEDPYL